jgi:hypothetical protein
MPVPSERLAGWLTPKWLVAGVALAACGLLLSYDVRLGLAAGALFGAVLVVWFYLALRYGSLSGVPSVRTTLVERAQQQEANRRLATTRAGSAPQESSDPAQRP